VRRGASWTARHLQLTVAAGDRARPGSPCCCAVLVGWSPRRRLPSGASSRHPAVGRSRRSVSTMWCPPSGAVSGSGGPAAQCPAARCPTRPASSPSGVQPVWCPPVQPAAVRPGGPDASISSHRRRWRWEPGRCGGQPAPRERVQSRWGCHVVERLGQRPSRPGPGRRCRGRLVVSGVSVADLGRVWCGPRRRRWTAARPGQVGVRSARGFGGAVGGSRLQREVAAPAAWLPAWLDA
jgi:hypothetical protein